VPTLPRDLQTRVEDKKGAIVINPLDLRMGPAGSPTWANEVLDLVLSARPFADVLLHVDTMAYFSSTLPGRMPGLQHFVAMMESLSVGRRPDTRIAVVTRNSARAPGPYGDEMHQTMLNAGLPVFDRLGEAAAAIAAAKRFTHHRRIVHDASK